jgi:GNAT superfamily N-acetyltransferase
MSPEKAKGAFYLPRFDAQDRPMNENLTGHPKWRAATASDLEVIQRIGDEIHVDLPERPEVFTEKFNLFPEGCFALVQDAKVVGYGFSHPWLLKSIPPLDRFLGSLPQSPECLFIHDVVVLQQARGHDAAGDLIEIIARLARQRGIAYLALVSVYNTHPLWARFGFETMTDAALNNKLKSYGNTARYMVRKLH